MAQIACYDYNYNELVDPTTFANITQGILHFLCLFIKKQNSHVLLHVIYIYISYYNLKLSSH